MDAQLIEQVAKDLWDRSQQNPAEQYRYKHIALRKGAISWKEICDIDLIPSIADEYRDRARICIKSMRAWIASNSKDSIGMVDLFLSATMNGE